MKKQLLVVAILLISLVAAVAHAIPATVNEVKIDGTTVNPNDVSRLNIERGQQFEVEVQVTATNDAPNTQVEAYIAGYEYNNDPASRIDDVTPVFDMNANVTYVKRLHLTLPTDVDRADYKVRVIVSDRNGVAVTQDYNLQIDATRHSVVIQDVLLSPSGEVRSGSALLATVRVENYGQNAEDNVKVTTSIPALGVSASGFIDEIKEGKQKDSEELYLRIPKCAKAGSYDLNVEVDYSRGHSNVQKVIPIQVATDDTCTPAPVQPTQQGPQTIITLGSQLETATQGGQVIFPITLTNNGQGARSYTVTITGADWADVKLSPASTVVVDAGRSQTINAFVTVKSDAQAGPQTLTATVTSGTEKLQDLTLTANVTQAQASGWDTVKRVLVVTLIVLVALLVILGLIIGISRMKGQEEDSSKSQTYY